MMDYYGILLTVYNNFRLYKDYNDLEGDNKMKCEKCDSSNIVEGKL